MVKSIAKIVIPIFNAYICLFAMLGIFLYVGGTMKNEVGLMIIPFFIAMIYGAYIGYRATKDI